MLNIGMFAEIMEPLSGDESEGSLPSPGFTSSFARSRAEQEVRVRQPPAKLVIHGRIFDHTRHQKGDKTGPY